MEVSDRDGELLRSTIRTQSTGSNTGVSSYPEQRDDPEPDIQPESNQGTLGPGDDLPPQADIETRIQQLNSRRFLLQHVRQMSKDTNGGTITESESVFVACECLLVAYLYFSLRVGLQISNFKCLIIPHNKGVETLHTILHLTLLQVTNYSTSVMIMLIAVVKK